jgi:hypothetical protein
MSQNSCVEMSVASRGTHENRLWSFVAEFGVVLFVDLDNRDAPTVRQNLKERNLFGKRNVDSVFLRDPHDARVERQANISNAAAKPLVPKIDCPLQLTLGKPAR